MLLNRNLLVGAGLVVVASGAAFGIYRVASRETPPAFRFTTVTRGAIQALVSATGTLQAVTTVSVGTRVSGQVSELLVDFNEHVKKGQLLARIDPTIAQQVADATVRSARVALERAKQNLSFTSIYAPIDGVVVERNVNLGQTVAASLSAPQLFLIASDLSRMQILALVGESDIVRIRQGQTVDFTVQALQGQKLPGTVEQVRLQSTTADNVVNYTVVVTLENPGGKLLPGMAARVDFLVRSAENVLRVPNAALRYKPSEEVLARFGAAPASPAAGPAAGNRRDERGRHPDGRDHQDVRHRIERGARPARGGPGGYER